MTTRACRSLALVAATLLLCSAISYKTARAQTSAQPTFRASTTLVEFTVVVQDHNGNPVTDLKQDEIAITEAGRPRDVAFFRFEGMTDTRAGTATLPKGMFSNRPEYSRGAPRNITAIVLDALNTAPQDQLTVRAQVLQYLSTITPDTRVALYRAGEHISVLHDFTDDVRSLRARFANNAMEAPHHTGNGVTVEIPDVPDYQRQAFEMQETDLVQAAYRDQARLSERSNQQIQDSRSATTLKTLEILGNHLAAIPGRKSVVWITPGTPMVSIGAGDNWLRSYEAAIRDLARRMATQGITLYPVEASGIKAPELRFNPPVQGSSRGSTVASRIEAARAAAELPKDASTSTDERRLPASMELLARVTGGRIVKNTNDLTAGMKVAASDLRGAYSVGFYVAQNPDNQWHTFNVHVARQGVKVIHRQGYLGIPDRQPQEWNDDDWRAASNNPLGSTAIRLDARCTLLTDILNVVMHVAAEDLQFRVINNAPVTAIDVALAEKTPEGLLGVRHERLTFQIQDTQAADLTQVSIRFPKDWPVKTAASTLRLLVRDRFTSRYGTIDLRIKDLIR